MGLKQIEYDASHAIRDAGLADTSNDLDMYDRWL
jgi:hypothetical protein